MINALSASPPSSLKMYVIAIIYVTDFCRGMYSHFILSSIYARGQMNDLVINSFLYIKCSINFNSDKIKRRKAVAGRKVYNSRSIIILSANINYIMHFNKLLNRETKKKKIYIYSHFSDRNISQQLRE